MSEVSQDWQSLSDRVVGDVLGLDGRRFRFAAPTREHFEIHNQFKGTGIINCCINSPFPFPHPTFNRYL